jgi:hypothetical protein
MGVFKYDFDNIARNAMCKYAKENRCAEKQVRVMMYLDDEENDCYAIYIQNSFYKKVSILNLLNRKIDFTGESLVISHFVKRELKKLSEENGIEKTKVRITILLSESGKVLLYLLNGSNAVKILNPEDVLADEKFAEAGNDLLKQME